MFCCILYIKSLKAVSTNISIIIPAFNSERFIKECVTNILNKINKKIELIIKKKFVIDLCARITISN